MIKIIFLTITLFISGLISSSSDKVFAAKKFVPKKAAPVFKKAVGVAIPSIVKYRGDKRAIYLSFSNFSGIETVSYSFTYSSNGNPQGAGGSITSSNDPMQQRELLFGTCSTSVCTYHANITNARLTLTAKYQNGRTSSKVYKIKSYL